MFYTLFVSWSSTKIRARRMNYNIKQGERRCGSTGQSRKGRRQTPAPVMRRGSENRWHRRVLLGKRASRAEWWKRELHTAVAMGDKDAAAFRILPSSLSLSFFLSLSLFLFLSLTPSRAASPSPSHSHSHSHSHAHSHSQISQEIFFYFYVFWILVFYVCFVSIFCFFRFVFSVGKWYAGAHKNLNTTNKPYKTIYKTYKNTQAIRTQNLQNTSNLQNLKTNRTENEKTKNNKNNKKPNKTP